MIVEEQQRQHLPDAPSSRPKASEIQAREVSRELSGKIKGEVRFDEGSRALYATDLSMYRQVPIGVVLPRDAEDVFETAAICRRYDVPLLGRGCGTSLAGQCCNVAVVVDFSKYMNHVLDVDPKTQRARVEPGVIYDQLRDATEKHHLVFAPDPATHAYCTLGGMIGNDSCGVHSIMGGRTVDNVHELEILTYDGLHMRVGPTDEAELERIIQEGGRKGEIYARLKALRDNYADKIRERFPNIPRRVSGYNLPELLPERGFQVARSLVGSESTCALVLSATVDLLHSPSQRALLVIGYPDIFQAADQVVPIRDMGPVGLEAVQTHVIQNMERKGQPMKGARLMPEGDTWLLVEFGGETPQEAEAQAREAQEKLAKSGVRPESMKLLTDKEEQLQVWEVREAGVGASRVPNVEDAWPSWEDSAVAPAKLGAYLRDFYKLLEKYHYRWTIFGHFGDGCVHCRITFDTKTPEGVKTYRAFMIEAAHLVTSYGGSLSGEHGDGQARGPLLPIMYGSEIMEAFREFKSIWDPRGRMNPGKKIDAYPLDQNLRVDTCLPRSASETAPVPIPVRTYRPHRWRNPGHSVPHTVCRGCSEPGLQECACG
jgi:FAD/FMN-containing dehydrogenase